MSFFDADGALIENVKKYPILYRSKGKNYKHFIYKDNCWKKVATALNKTPDECKAKWRNIRDSYIKNRKKKITGAVGVSKYDDERLNFLAETLENTDPLCQIDNSTSSSYSCELVKDEFDSSEEVPLSESPFIMNVIDTEQTHTYTPSLVTTTYDPNNSISTAELNVNTETDEQNQPKPKRTMKRKVDTIIDELKRDREERNTILQRLVTKATGPGESPTHNFFSSMADIVSKFPPEKIVETRMKICSVVSEMELSILRDGSQSTSQF